MPTHVASDQVYVEAVRTPVDQVAHGFSMLDVVRPTAAGWVKAQADSRANAGVAVVVEVINANRFTVVTHGYAEIEGHGLTNDTPYYLSDSVAGEITTAHVGIDQFVLLAIDDNTIYVTATLALAYKNVFDEEGYDEDTAFRQTTSTTFITAHSFVTPSLPAGTYEFEAHYVWSYDIASDDIRVRFQVDGTNLIDPGDTGEHREEPADSLGSGLGGTDQRLLATWKRRLTFGTAGTHTITLLYAGSGGDEANIYHSILSYRRVG